MTRKVAPIKKTIPANFARAYAGFGLLVVLVSTLFWSLLGAKLQQGNADQLVNTYLFENSETFRGATLPSAHSFLIKWPLFYLIKLFGSSGAVIEAATVAVVILAVACLLLVIYKIDRRPLVFGTLCLGLASAMLLIPAQPYVGGLLPVNMAMLATRNLEYVVYIATLVLLTRSPKVRSWSFWLAVVMLGLLIASDKLFMALAIGGAVVMLAFYSRAYVWKLAGSSANWLSVGLVGAILAVTILKLINIVGLTHISSQGSISPYGLNAGAPNIGLGVIYAVAGLFTNFGANPAFDATIVRNIPHQAIDRLASVSGPAYVINAAILLFGIFVSYKLIASSWSERTSKKEPSASKANLLALMLIWTSIVAIASFIGTNHYYAVDARYLTIGLFAIFVSFAVYFRQRNWQPTTFLTIGAVLTIGVILGLFGASRNYNESHKIVASQTDRNQVVAQVLEHHPVKTLVGDYWRVIPTKESSKSKIDVTPLANCTSSRQVLSTSTWQPDLYKVSFAYLLTLDGSHTDFPNCQLDPIVKAYGRPNSSTLIAGSLNRPKELLLFYDKGINNSSPKLPQPPKGPATVLPITLDEQPYTTCSFPSIVNVVAHQDDDLLFMNPDTLHDIKAGYCVRTIYITAGDSGSNQFYWLGRERGSEAAYNKMLGSNEIWIQRIVELPGRQFVTIANPRSNPKISLIFLHLPDGNLKGQGFNTSHNESLSKLEAGKINTIHSVDGQSAYSFTQLVSALSTLMNVYQATEIHTQSDMASKTYPDHSDHGTVGRIAKKAYVQFEYQKFADQVTIPLKYYLGYQIHQMPTNISDGDLNQKEAAFLEYAKFDSNVCQSYQKCQQTPTYGSYLTRQYQQK